MAEQLTLDSASSARLSDCGRYRYTLSRRWDSGDLQVVYVALNPSTADASQDDPTIRRMRFFAERALNSSMVIVNLFALRATNPRELWAVSHAERVGPENLQHLRSQAQRARRTGEPVIFAFGAVNPPAAHRDSVRAHIETVCGIFDGCAVWCLGTTQAGWPRHPLYLPRTAPAREWSIAEVNDG